MSFSKTINSLIEFESNSINSGLSATNSVWSSISFSSNLRYQIVTSLLIGDTSGYVYTSTDYGDTWSRKDNLQKRNWYASSVSENGQYQTITVAFDANTNSNGVYVSSNYGSNFTKTLFPVNASSVKMSSNGQYQTCIGYNDYIYISSDYGATWNDVAESLKWKSLEVSTDGQYQIAITEDGFVYNSIDYGLTWTDTNNDFGFIYFNNTQSENSQYQLSINRQNICTSNDYGRTWDRRLDLGSRPWNSVSISSDGRYQIATTSISLVYKSNDYGVTWTSSSLALLNRNWKSIKISSTGQYQTGIIDGGQIYTSNDYGVTWTVDGLNKNWKAIEMSSDGQYQIAIASGTDKIYKSIDFGLTWMPVQSNRLWNSIAMSSTGQYQTAVVSNGQIYRSADYGATWTAVQSNRDWQSVIISSAGNNQTAFVNITNNGDPTIYRSTDYGVTWTAVAYFKLYKIAMSASGEYQTAINTDTNVIWQSIDFGQTWISSGFGMPSIVNSIIISDNAAIQTIVDSGGNIVVYNFGAESWGYVREDVGNNYKSAVMSTNGLYQAVIDVNNNIIYRSSDFGQTWTPVNLNRAWQSIAMSSDGMYLTAVVNNGKTYISTDYGVTWTQESDKNWISSSCSSNGEYQTIVANNGQIYRSDDYGVTWIPIQSNRSWVAVVMSSTGQHQTAVVDGGKIYRSTDYGLTWSASQSDRTWKSIAMSSTGQYRTAVVSSGPIFRSTDYGLTWIPLEANRGWNSVAMSSTGQYQTAVVNNGRIYRSTDYGLTWNAVESNREWYGVAMSSTGQYQTAVLSSGFSFSGQIYRSTDYGLTWDIRFLNKIYMSKSDKNKLKILAYNDYIYQSNDFGSTWNTMFNLGIDYWQSFDQSSDFKYQFISTSSSNNDVYNGLYYSENYGDTFFKLFDFKEKYNNLKYIEDFKLIATYDTSIDEFYANNNIVGYTPFNLKIDFSNLTIKGFYNKIYKIEYIFGDGTSKTESLTLDKNPLSPVQIHQYNFNDAFVKNYVLTIKIHQFSLENTSDYTFNISLSAPSLANLSDSYFDEIHLIGSRMFGVDNNLVYLFETKNPDFIIPVMVNWKQRPEAITPEIPIIPPMRAYKMLSPFENEVVTSADNGSHIDLLIPTLPSLNKPNPDNNSDINRTYP